MQNKQNNSIYNNKLLQRKCPSDFRIKYTAHSINLFLQHLVSQKELHKKILTL